LSGIFVTDGKKQKTKQKQKKTSVKHIRIRLIGGCVNNETVTGNMNKISA